MSDTLREGLVFGVAEFEDGTILRDSDSDRAGFDWTATTPGGEPLQVDAYVVPPTTFGALLYILRTRGLANGKCQFKFVDLDGRKHEPQPTAGEW